MPPENPQSINPSEEDITALAHQLWEEEGRPEGKADEHWRRAEAQLRGDADEVNREPKVV
jgi:hypothetical protein